MPKILVTDDAAFMRMMIKSTIEKLGNYSIIEAVDGNDAIEKYKVEQPDLVLLDVTMPNLDGIGALKGIKKIDPNAKIVMCSAMGQEAIVVEAIKLGALDFIVKPFKAERINKTISAIFG
jgi:two-component system chemotaxis response regulator CheY